MNRQARGQGLWGGAIFSGWARELSGSVRRKVAGSFLGRSLRGPLERKRKKAGLRGAKLRPVKGRSQSSLGLRSCSKLFAMLSSRGPVAQAAKRPQGGGRRAEFSLLMVRKRAVSRTTALRKSARYHYPPLTTPANTGKTRSVRSLQPYDTYYN